MPRRCATTLARLGVDDVEVVEADGRAYDGERFDAILVDAPCSGLGVLNGRPDSRWRRSPSDVEALAVLQTELVAHARELLAPGRPARVRGVHAVARRERARAARGGSDAGQRAAPVARAGGGWLLRRDAAATADTISSGRVLA